MLLCIQVLNFLFKKSPLSTVNNMHSQFSLSSTQTEINKLQSDNVSLQPKTLGFFCCYRIIRP